MREDLHGRILECATVLEELRLRKRGNRQLLGDLANELRTHMRKVNEHSLPENLYRYHYADAGLLRGLAALTGKDGNWYNDTVIYPDSLLSEYFAELECLCSDMDAAEYGRLSADESEALLAKLLTLHGGVIAHASRCHRRRPCFLSG